MTVRPGFALPMSLCCLSFLLMSALVAQALLTVEIRASAVHVAASKARLDLQQAALLSQAKLQAAVGKDAVHTFERQGVCWVGSPTGSAESLSGVAEDMGWSWAVRDLSQSHDVGAERRTGLNDDDWISGPWGRGKVPIRKAEPEPSAEERRALELRWSPDGSAPRDCGSRGLLTDPLVGGHRTDLSDDRSLELRLGRESYEKWAALWSRGDPQRGLDAGAKGAHCPLLAGMTLSIGVFNSRADGRHRIRFHAAGLMWNDLGVPLTSAGRGRMLLVELRGAPTVTIRNLDSGAEVEADLDDLPLLDLGALEQGRRERSLWFMVGVSDPAVPPMTAPGMFGGESYAFIAPEPSAQPQGLARILSGKAWRMDRRVHGPGWRRPEPETMVPNDRISITFRFEGETSLVVRRHAGDPSRDTGLEDYPGEVCQLVDGLRFESFVIETTADEYSRPDSSGYRLGERRACLSAAPMADSSGGLLSWRRETRAGRRAPWSVRHPLAFDRPEEDFVRRAGDVIWDETPNAHGTGLAPRFGRAVGPELPLRPIISPGSLRHMGDARWTEALDSGTFLPRAGRPSHPRIMPWRTAAGACALDFFIDGAFNVNSASREAWASLLWSAGARPFSPAAACFPTRPTSVNVPLVGLAELRLWDDEELDALAAERLEESVINQPIRLLSRSQVDRLAEALAEEVLAGGPFPSLAAFSEAGAIDRALATAGLNRRLEAHGEEVALRLSGADIVELFGPQLGVRGDTFAVDIAVSRDGCHGFATFVMQRMPETEALPAHLGRRIKVISMTHPGGSIPSGLTAGRGR